MGGGAGPETRRFDRAILRSAALTVRHNAALALAKIGPSAESAAGALQAAQEDEDLYVRENARIALSRIEA